MKRAISRKNIWENLPPIAKKIAGAGLSLIPLQLLMGKTYRETVKLINDSQTWSKHELESYQLSGLKRITTLAYEKSKFYKNIFDEVGFDPHDLKNFEQIEKIPFIDKSTIITHCDDIITVPKNAANVDYITTGGTSGVPLVFYTTANRSQPEMAYLSMGWSRVGYKLGSPMAVLRGRNITKKKGIYYEYDPVFRHHFYSNFHLTDENMEKYLDHIKTLGPCYLHVYPSSVYYLARFVKKSGYKAPKNIIAIIAESENVYDEQRALVESVFESRYFSSYGHTEKLIAAAECEHSSDYHVWPTYGYFELIDKSGNKITSSGQIGEIVGTGFINDVMPFIRYKTGDYAEYVGERCDKCGRNFTIIKNIRGHNTQEILIAKDGSFIPWSAVNMHDDTFDNVNKFQFEQKEPGKATLKIVVTSRFTDTDKGRIERNLKKKFNERLFFNIERVEDIKLSKVGKSIFVDQKIKIDDSL